MQKHNELIFKSGKRDSNSRPSAWEADALPTELLPHFFICDAKVGYFLKTKGIETQFCILFLLLVFSL